MKNLCFIIVATLYFVSCNSTNKDEKVFQNQLLLFSVNVDGLETSDSLFIERTHIGLVKEFKLMDQKGVLVICELNERLEIPIDSKFQLVTNLLGQNRIEIIKGTSKSFFQPLDTCKAEVFLPEFELTDSLQLKLQLINELIQSNDLQLDQIKNVLDTAYN